MTTHSQTHPHYIAGTWKVDAAHSEISFSVKHLAISKVRGSFETFDLSIVTAEDPKDSSIVASVDVASVNTNQKDRDNHLRTSDFFLVEEFPTMDFSSTSFTIEGDDFTVDGNLTLRGVTLPIVVKGEFGGITTDGYGQTKAGATAHFVIDRTAYGVNWNAAVEAGGFTLGNDVTVNLELQVQLQA